MPCVTILEGECVSPPLRLDVVLTMLILSCSLQRSVNEQRDDLSAHRVAVGY